jgi:hypothetical protein
MKYRIKRKIMVTVHGSRFRGSGFSSNLPAIISPAFQSFTADRYCGQGLTVDLCVMIYHASVASRREAERMKTERLVYIES